MSARRRINLSVTDGRYGQLSAEAQARGEWLTTYLGHLVNLPAPARIPARASPMAQSSKWLEPSDAGLAERAEWCGALWCDVCGLARRYAQAFATLERHWTSRTDRVETLGALVAWRSRLDNGIDADHRSALQFHRALLEWSNIWRSTSQGTDLHSFNPDQQPPEGWTSPPQRPESGLPMGNPAGFSV